MKVSISDWEQVNKNLQEWRKNRSAPPSIPLYRKIVDEVFIGASVLDVGAGQCHLFECLPDNVDYIPVDPFPIRDHVIKESAENLVNWDKKFDTVFMLSALDNVQDLELSLKGLKNVAKLNIVIFTAIDVEPDKNHTVKVSRKFLVKILGNPIKEIQMLPKTYLFEFSA